MKKSQFFVILFLIFSLCSCTNRGGVDDLSSFDHLAYKPVEASGFTIKTQSAQAESGAANKSAEASLITIKSPWQGSQAGDSLNFIIKQPAQRIVAMSSTHVAMLDRLGAVDRIVGVSGIDFIANEYIQTHRDKIVDVGNEQYVDFEKLIALNPDLVLIYGVNGPSAMEFQMKELKIPFIYIGDYIEQSPLGKAEWIVALAQIIGCRERGIEIFNEIRERYDTVRAKVSNVTTKPKVMLNVPYNDSWFMPSVNNYAVRLINDAGGEYLFAENESNASQPIDIERAYQLASDADVWLNPGRLTSIDEMKNMLPRFAKIGVLKKGKVYNNDARSTPRGGNDFYESGTINPDVVLSDLISIFHPEIAADSLTYYRQLK